MPGFFPVTAVPHIPEYKDPEYKVIQDTVNGEFKGQVYNFGLKENGVGTTDFKYTRQIIGSENINFVENLKADIISGKIKVN